MAREGTLSKMSLLFNISVVDRLQAHSAKTGISVAEIIRRAFDLYLFLDKHYNEEIPEQYVTQPLQPDGSPYPDTAKRLVFHIDPYLAVRLQDWQGAEPLVLGYAVLAYTNVWAEQNPEAAANPDFVFQAPVAEPIEGEAGATDRVPPEGEPLEESEFELDDCGNPIGTKYDGNGVALDATGNPLGTLYDEEGNPTNLDARGNLILPEVGDGEADPLAAELTSTASGEINPEVDDAESYFEAAPSPDGLDDEGQPTQDEHGNPIGTLYTYETNEETGEQELVSVNLDDAGNLVELEEVQAAS